MKAHPKALAVRSVLFLYGLTLVCGPSISAQTEESTKTWAATSIRGVSTEKPAAEWWNSFHDEELTRLIHRAVANNLDLRLAAARVDEARAARGVAKSAFYPSVGVTTSAERLRERVASFNPGTNTPDFHPVELNNFQVGFDSAWEIDANVRSAEEDRRDVLVVLLGEIARTRSEGYPGHTIRFGVCTRMQPRRQDSADSEPTRCATIPSSELLRSKFCSCRVFQFVIDPEST